ncbi:HlyD family secretion protein [Acinetobacter guerrae]|uniref:HlyD family secretion protein n=2 Tax=Acinetobacter guerrae TaxID=1843371 RepID=A0A3A8ENF2_9GAMM|nr:HlyD family secretion protein [Acinetobacter guerrae]
MMIIILWLSYNDAKNKSTFQSQGEIKGALMESESIVSEETVEHPVVDNAIQSPQKDSKKRKMLVIAIALTCIGGGVGYILLPASSQSTDNAYVSTDSIAVAPKVQGLVAKVYVQDNQVIHQGDPLIQIDTEEFDTKVNSAKADLANALANVNSVKAEFVTLNSEEKYASSNIQAAQSSIVSAQENAKTALQNKKRYDQLLKAGAVSQQETEDFNNTAVSATQSLSRIEAELNIAKSAADVTHSKRIALDAKLDQAHANVEKAQANLELALQNQKHSLIVSPINGLVANRQAQVGDYVQVGRQLLTLVPEQQRYIIANFKETQIAKMHAGQIAEIKIDALPQYQFSGHVQSLAPGSGSTFALLPFEPGTGNFTKIVQRVPVKITFDTKQNGLDLLRPGLSADVKVQLK